LLTPKRRDVRPDYEGIKKPARLRIDSTGE